MDGLKFSAHFDTKLYSTYNNDAEPQTTIDAQWI